MEKNMKRAYQIDFVTNTITISKSFAEEAKLLDTPANKLMMRLRKEFHDMPISIKTKAPRKKANRLSYQKMEKYINCVSNAESYLEEFAAVREVSCGQKNPYQFVLKWFKNTFPNHEEQPEFDENLELVVTPMGYSEKANEAA